MICRELGRLDKENIKLLQSVVSFTRVFVNKAIAIRTCYWLAVICDLCISSNAKIWSIIQEFACHNNLNQYFLGFFERDQKFKIQQAIQSLYVYPFPVNLFLTTIIFTFSSDDVQGYWTHIFKPKLDRDLKL